jgi:hypothetical protein
MRLLITSTRYVCHSEAAFVRVWSSSNAQKVPDPFGTDDTLSDYSGIDGVMLEEASLYDRNCSSRVARTYCTFWWGIIVLYTRWEYLSPFIIFLVAVELSDSHIWWLDIMKMDNLERNLIRVWAAANHDCELQFMAKMKSLSCEPSWRTHGECALWRITGWWAVVDVARQCHRLGCTLEMLCNEQ